MNKDQPHKFYSEHPEILLEVSPGDCPGSVHYIINFGVFDSLGKGLECYVRTELAPISSYASNILEMLRVACSISFRLFCCWARGSLIGLLASPMNSLPSGRSALHLKTI